jgi:glycosyltransferase involved in cell wall biosynthesis
MTELLRAAKAASESERPLRVLQVAGTSVGGDWFHDQVNGLAKRGHVVRVVLPGPGPLGDRLRASGIEATIVPFGLTRHARELPQLSAAEFRLLRLVRAFRPDVIHAHLLRATLACRVASLSHRHALRVSQAPGMPSLHTPRLQRLDRMTLFRDDVVIGSCRAIADQYQEMGARRVAVSYYGCDVHRLDPQTSGEEFRQEFGLDMGTPVIGMVAHMYPTRLHRFHEMGIKGHEVFLDAAPLILARTPSAHMFVVGDELAGDGTYRRALEARAAALGVAGKVHFTGHRHDIATVLAGLDIVVNPSLEESACYTMVEALLMERGVVASNVGGLPDTVQHGSTGLLIPPADPAALAAAVTELIADPRQRREMGRRGRQHCLHQFDIEATVATVESIYLQALSDLQQARFLRLRGGPADYPIGESDA